MRQQLIPEVNRSRCLQSSAAMVLLDEKGGSIDELRVAFEELCPLMHLVSPTIFFRQLQLGSTVGCSISVMGYI